jgi:hypothetical protein
MRWAALGALVVLIGLVSTACSDSGPTAESATEDTGSTVADASPPAVATELDCVTRDYPCSWSEATPEAVSRTDVILQTAAALLSAGESVADVAARIEAADGVVAVGFDEIGINFRVDGGLPAIVDFDPTGTGTLLGAAPPPPADGMLPSLALAQSGAFAGCGPADDEADGVRGVSRAPDLDRKALILSPWQFGLPWDLDSITDNLLAPGSRYLAENGGSVIQHASWSSGESVLEASAGNVVPAHFCGWEKYDTIILLTHGRALCSGGTEVDPTGCLTTFSVGRYSENLEELKALVGGAQGVTVGTSHYGDLLRTLSVSEKQACYEALERLLYPEGTSDACFQKLPEPKYSVSITTDFFRANYPDGLPDRVIFLAACQGMKLRDVAAALGRGQNGIIMGFDKISTVWLAQNLLDELSERLGKGKRIGDGYMYWANDFLDKQGAHPELWEQPLSELPGGELGDLVNSDVPPAWGQDAVRIMSEGSYLADQAVVKLADPPPNPEVDALDVTLVLTDVEEEESPEDFAVELWFNDEKLDLDEPVWQQAEGTEYRAKVVVDLPRPLEPDEKFDLEIRAILPAADGGPTRVKYEEVTADPVVYCERLSPEAVSAALGVEVEPVESGELGAFFGSFCMWQDDTSQVQVLVNEGAAAGFRAEWANSELAVDGFGDVAIYDPVTGGGTDCGSITNFSTGRFSWICFVNLNVAVGNDVLYFTLSGNVVGENGPDGALEVLRELVEAIRQP